MFGKLSNVLYSFVLNLCKVLLVAQVLIVSWVVFGRYILDKTPGWGEEAALLCMVWFCLVSATLAIKEDSHLKMTIIELILPAKAVRFLDHMNDALVLCFAIFMVIAGINLTELTALNILPGMNIKSSWLYASVPVAGITMVFALLERMRKILP